MSEGQGRQSIANTPAVSWPVLEMGSHYLLTERHLFPTAVTQSKWFSILTRKDFISLQLTDGERMPLGVRLGV